MRLFCGHAIVLTYPKSLANYETLNNQRESIVEIINGRKQSKEKYLGVAFWDGPEHVPFDEPIKVKMVLMYFPTLSYSEVIPGETFTLREGGSIVGYGHVQAKYMQSFQD